MNNMLNCEHQSRSRILNRGTMISVGPWWARGLKMVLSQSAESPHVGTFGIVMGGFTLELRLDGWTDGHGPVKR